MSEVIVNRHRWSWRSCFALVKHNKKSKKQNSSQSNLRKSSSNGDTNNKKVLTINENSNTSNGSTEKNNKNDKHEGYSLATESNTLKEYSECIGSSSCIIKIEKPFDDVENSLIAGDSLQKISVDDIDASVTNHNSSSIIRSTHLDAIVEDSNEENSDGPDETIQSVRLFCDREIVDDSKNLHSRLFDLSKMNHVITQFNENGNLLGEFKRQIEKLKIKADDIARVSAQMPRDAELLEARYSTLLATIESLSLLLKIAQIPACRSLINRLVFSINQRTEQLTKLIQLTLSSSMSYNSYLRRDLNDDDFLSFRSALSSYEHLLTMS